MALHGNWWAGPMHLVCVWGPSNGWSDCSESQTKDAESGMEGFATSNWAHQWGTFGRCLMRSTFVNLHHEKSWKIMKEYGKSWKLPLFLLLEPQIPWTNMLADSRYFFLLSHFIVVSLSFCHCSWKLLLDIYSLQFQAAEGTPCRPKGLLSDLKGQNAALQEIFWEDRNNTWHDSVRLRYSS